MQVEKPMDSGGEAADKEKFEIEIVENEEALKEEPKVQRQANGEDDDEGDGEEYGERVKRRLGKLTAKLRAAERERDKFRSDWERERQEKERATHRIQESDIQAVLSQEARIEAERARLERDFTRAYDEGDRNALWQAQKELAQVEAHAKALELYKTQHGLETRHQPNGQDYRRQPQQREQPSQQQPQPPKLLPITEEWIAKNPRFTTDRTFQRWVKTIDSELAEEGYDPSSTEFYNELDVRLREAAPQLFKEDAPRRKTTQPVGGVSRAPAGNQKIRLTESEAATARRLGVPLAEYARYVKR